MSLKTYNFYQKKIKIQTRKSKGHKKELKQ